MCILAHVEEYNDQGIEPPCCEGDAEYPAVAQWNGVPCTDKGDPALDVVYATHPSAYVPELRNGANVVDEEADFTVDLAQDRIRWMVTACLKAVNAPVKTWKGLISLAQLDGGGGDVGAERDALKAMLCNIPEWYINHPNAHALRLTSPARCIRLSLMKNST